LIGGLFNFGYLMTARPFDRFANSGINHIRRKTSVKLYSEAEKAKGRLRIVGLNSVGAERNHRVYCVPAAKKSDKFKNVPIALASKRCPA
jgi:hypothetical protein